MAASNRSSSSSILVGAMHIYQRRPVLSIVISWNFTITGGRWLTSCFGHARLRERQERAGCNSTLMEVLAPWLHVSALLLLATEYIACIFLPVSVWGSGTATRAELLPAPASSTPWKPKLASTAVSASFCFYWMRLTCPLLKVAAASLLGVYRSSRVSCCDSQ
jgi:hypothetical protein